MHEDYQLSREGINYHLQEHN